MRPCSICGAEGKYVGIFGHYENGTRVGYFGGCWTCGNKTDNYISKEEALEAWEKENETYSTTSRISQRP